MAQAKRHAGGLRPDKYLSGEQVKRLRAYVKKEADRARARGSRRAVVNEMIVEVLLFTGVRAEELCRLQIRDLPLSHGKPVIYIRNSKYEVARTIEIPECLARQLHKFVKQYRKNSKPKSPLFVSESGYRKLNWVEQRRSKADGRLIVRERSELTSRLAYHSLYSKLSILGQKAGIGRLTAHMLRHTYLTRLYNVEHDLLFTQSQAGHANPNTTAVYAQTALEARRRQVETLDF